MEFKANPKLDAALEALHSDMIETLQRWIRIPSVRADRSADNAPFGAEVRRALDVAMAEKRKPKFVFKKPKRLCSRTTSVKRNCR